MVTHPQSQNDAGTESKSQETLKAALACTNIEAGTTRGAQERAVPEYSMDEVSEGTMVPEFVAGEDATDPPSPHSLDWTAADVRDRDNNNKELENVGSLAQLIDRETGHNYASMEGSVDRAPEVGVGNTFIPLAAQPRPPAQASGPAPATDEDCPSPEGILLIDAWNSFNEILRKAMLWTVWHLWPDRNRLAAVCY